MRLDVLLARHTRQSRQRARALLVAGRVSVAGRPCADASLAVDEFTHVALDGAPIHGRQAYYLMLHKPPGYLSATSDPHHPTVMALIDAPYRDELHLVGRLDINTTGLLLLTNDGRWSQRLMRPELKVAKVYRVQTLEPIAPDTEAVFARGMYFAREGITTQPVQLERLGERSARLTLREGRYRQIRRMFGYLGNQVVDLHRERIGDIVLDPALAPGQFRPLNPAEIDSLRIAP